MKNGTEETMPGTFCGNELVFKDLCASKTLQEETCIEKPIKHF